jgi:3-oxoacyl-[acyl-carrier protein] reductase
MASQVFASARPGANPYETRRVVLITGASGSIGKAIAGRLARDRFALALQYFEHPISAATGTSSPDRSLRHPVGEPILLQADLRDESQIKAMVAQAEAQYGGIDVLVNNAGTALPQKLVTDTTAAEFDSLFALDVRGVFLCCKAVLPAMVRQKYGRIINISSMWGVGGASCEVAYSAAKAAVIGLTKALAKETAPSGITVNCVAPGVIDTRMNAHLPSEDLQQLAHDTPIGRLGTPQDVADAVAYFAGEAASFVTGQTLLIDGGFMTA